MSLVRPADDVNLMLELITKEFKTGIRAALLAKLQADIAPELERIASEEAERLSKCILTYYRDERMMTDWLQWRISINGQEVPSDGQKVNA